MHLERESTGTGLTLALTGGRLAEMREVLLPCGLVSVADAFGLGTDVIDEDLEVHLGLAAQTLDVGHEVTLIGADRAAQSVVVLKGGAEAERKDG